MSSFPGQWTGARCAARLWNAGDQVFRSFNDGDFVHVDGKVQLFEGSLQAILTRVERVGDGAVELTDFMPHTEHDVGKLLDRLRSYLLRLGNPHLRALAECFLMDDEFVRGFAACPAGVKLHHAYVGGLLEHTVTMMDIADRLLPFYPGTDRDLLLVGVFLWQLQRQPIVPEHDPRLATVGGHHG